VTRRRLLQSALAGGLTLALPRAFTVATARAQAAAPFTQPLRIPRTLADADITLPIAKADVQVLPGAATEMWTFGGEFPGPTIRRPAGATTRVTFEHGLPEAGTLTIHNHGHHTRSVDDGQPMAELIAPGGERTYTYEHVEEGKPLRAGMRWYHDHSHGRTGRNLWKGLLGLFIVEDPTEAGLGLPGPDRELVLVITETTLDAGNQLTDPFTGAADPASDGVGIGETVLVNGVPQPFVEVEPTRYRLRVLNAASFNPYSLGFSTGPKLVQVGNESGLFTAPLERERVLLGPAERADIVIDFSGHAGQDLVLSSAEEAAARSAPWSALTGLLSRPDDLLQLRVRGTPAASAAPAAALRPLPAWVAALPQQPDRILAFGRGIDPAAPSTQQVWTINGRTYDPATVVAQPALGDTETWLLVNASTQAHYVHLHDVDWKLIQRNGAAPEPHEDALKETFRLDAGDVVLVGTKFTDHLGTYMVHCHMLSHEDHAMMAPFEVVAAGAGDLPANPFDALTAAEAERVRAMLAAQAATPGSPAPVPDTLLLLERGSTALCDLDTTRRSR
jgi:FtsP/CotA-like multicopper oxidase with cupredoxin domain